MQFIAVTVVVVFSIFIFWVGIIKIVFVPLSLLFEIVRRRKAKAPLSARPLVSVVVPGYNEERVIESCVASIMRQDYENFELILVNDGSTDNTAQLMHSLALTDSRIFFIDQPNAGKGAALNTGTVQARGEFVMFVDADGVFAGDTIEQMLRTFENPRVGAVSGDDRPINLDRVLTKLLALISHVGTGFIRRALALINCLPVVSGNMGMFRRSALAELPPVNGAWPLRTDTLGEDLELTWRLHRAGYSVGFAPKAVVYAESPSTLRGLWRQRVRWARGMVQATSLHKDMMGNPKYGMFGPYLLFNFLSMVVVPVAQIFVLIGLPVVAITSPDYLPLTWVGWLGFLGVFLAIAILLYAIALNGAWADLRYFWVFPLWPIYATLIGFTLAWGLIQELRGSERNWNKLERTGTISIGGLNVEKQGGTQTA